LLSPAVLLGTALRRDCDRRAKQQRELITGGGDWQQWLKRRTKTHKDTDNFLVTVGDESG
jgi:hypothetical protein